MPDTGLCGNKINVRLGKSVNPLDAHLHGLSRFQAVGIGTQTQVKHYDEHRHQGNQNKEALHKGRPGLLHPKTGEGGGAFLRFHWLPPGFAQQGNGEGTQTDQQIESNLQCGVFGVYVEDAPNHIGVRGLLKKLPVQRPHHPIGDAYRASGGQREQDGQLRQEHSDNLSLGGTQEASSISSGEKAAMWLR